MSQRLLRCFPVAVVVAAALALSGCGGGTAMMPDDGSTDMPDDDTAMMPDDGSTDMPGDDTAMTPDDGSTDMPGDDQTLPVAEGLIRSTDEPVYATSAQSYETAVLSTRFPALSSHLQRDFTESAVTLGSDNVRIKSISVDDEAEDGGVVVSVNYVLDGEEVTVSFTTDDIVAANEWFVEIEELEGDGFSEFWTWYLAQFGRFAILGHSACAEEEGGDPDVCVRTYTAVGARTEAARMPAGTATYVGQARADSYIRDEPDNFPNRQRIWGLLRLTADFAGRRLEGRITDIAVRRQDERRASDWPDSTYLMISDGKIVDGQFTAELTGVESNANAPMDESLRGYEGDVLGEFYGPDAKAVGGVFNAGRADRVMVGAFSGEVFNSVRLAGSARAAVSAGVELDYPASTSQLTNAGVTAIESDGADGFHVTYTIDGVVERVHLPELLYDNAISRRSNDEIHWVWEDRYASALELDHLSVKGWWAGEFGHQRRGHFVFGETTAVLPAGTAEYAGRAYLNGFSAAAPGDRSWFRGDLSLTADFDSRRLGGRLDNWRIDTGGATRQYMGIDSELVIQNGTITNDGLNAELAGRQAAAGITGSMTGRFFGPDAAEVGGVIEAERPGDQVFEGWFAGEKQ